MPIVLPTLSVYDPAADSEGTLDPMGLYQIADQLATRLVPGVRERMQRIRFLTVISVGVLVTEDIPLEPDHAEVSPFLVWEWLIVEAMIRRSDDADCDDAALWGVPGTLVTRRSIDSPGYLDARGYLKTPRIFGFHGVYKRLAVRLGLVDAHMNPREKTRQLVDAWVADREQSNWPEFRNGLHQAVRNCLATSPCRTRPKWNNSNWHALADAFWPDRIGQNEKECLTELLRNHGDAHLGQLTNIWNIQQQNALQGISSQDIDEKTILQRLREDVPATGLLVDAITAYEDFSRGLHDAFDVIRFEVAGHEHIDIRELANNVDFAEAVADLDVRCAAARQRLAEFDSAMGSLFDQRFGAFFEPRTTADTVEEICRHHEVTQKGKSAAGKRPWFDRLGPNRIFLRHRYRQSELNVAPGDFVHAYRAKPIGRFLQDLSAD